MALAIGLSPVLFAGTLFQPGWANGWAIPQSVVYATFVTILVAVSVTSLATAALLVICYLAEERTKRPYLGWASFIVLFALAFVTVLNVSPRVYQAVHAEMEKAHPHATPSR